jgi:hypothetical protein
MTRTSQLDAHYAVLQLDALRQHVVMSYQPTCDMLVAEFEEKFAGTPKHSPARKRAVKWRTERLIRYRAAVLELAAAVLALRADCGIDPSDLPHGDDDVPPEHSRIRATHEAYLREKAGLPASDDGDVDDMVERHYEALLDYANGDGPGPRVAAAREGGAL